MRRLLPFALAGLLALTLLPGVRAVAPLDWREARDAAIAAQSTHGGDWYSPTWAGEPFFEKPVAGYAPELAVRLLLPARWRPRPEDPGPSRLLRAAFAAALAIVVAAIGTRTFGARAGWLAACALASAIGLPLAARADGGQLLATLCSWLGAGGLLAAARGRPRRRTLTLFAAWTALGLAILTGGPLSALWPLAGFALYFTLVRAHSGWLALRPIEGVAIVVAMALPWYGLTIGLFRGEFLAHLPWFPYASDPRGPWLAGPLLALSFVVVLGFPWTALLGSALRDTADRLRAPRPPGSFDLRDPNHAASLVLAFAVAAAVPVALYPKPPLTAALPALPAIALLCGRFLDRLLDGDVDARHLTSAARLCAFLGTATAVLGVMLASRLPGAASPLRLVAVVVLAASWAPLLADLAGRRRVAAACFALPVALGAPIVHTRVLPALEPWLSTRDVAEAMAARSPARAPLLLLDPAPPTLRLLLRRNLVVVPSVVAALSARPSLTAADGFVYFAFSDAPTVELLRAASPAVEVLARTPTLTLVRARPGTLVAPGPDSTGATAAP